MAATMSAMPSTRSIASIHTGEDSSPWALRYQIKPEATTPWSMIRINHRDNQVPRSL